jgi:hypothetical protein
MESDSIRASGNDTLIDIWVEGKLRAICVTREAIETYLGAKAPGEMSEDDRCEFVRKHLPQVVAAAQASLRGNASAATVIIDAGQLSAGGDRRKGERRKTDRRKSSRSSDELPHGERRRGQRRNGERRRSTKNSDS